LHCVDFQGTHKDSFKNDLMALLAPPL